MISKTNEELKQIAMSIFKGDVVTDRHVPSDLLMSVFMPLLFLSEEQREELKKEELGLIYGDMRDALPRGINGYPVFGACSYLNKEDAKTMFEILGRLKIMEVY